MPRKVILFELNEVPWRILDHFVRDNPGTALARTLARSHTFESVAADHGHLSPWTTWPSLHRGVNDEAHRIGDLGQDRTEADANYPPIWQLLHDEGVSVGVCGSLHSFPPPQELTSFAFYLPDTFATNHDAHPSALSHFQAFNLLMARDSARNVDMSVPVKAALPVLARWKALGIRASTFRALVGQLASERRAAWKGTRRRTFQAVLAFDAYYKQLERTKPAFSTFFSNHVASAMHRYWAATYPDDYEVLGLDQEWIDQYSEEIPWAMGHADRMFGRLVDFAARNPEYQVWLASSMGQGPTIARGLETAVYVKDLTTFMRRLGIADDAWEERPAMLPQTNVKVSDDVRETFEARLRGLKLGRAPIHFRKTGDGFFAMDFGHRNMHTRPTPMRYDGARLPLADFGLEAVEITDRSDTTAYHVPEGILVVHDPAVTSIDTQRTRVSALSVAPALLRTFGVKPRDYMLSGDELANVLT